MRTHAAETKLYIFIFQDDYWSDKTVKSKVVNQACSSWVTLNDMNSPFNIVFLFRGSISAEHGLGFKKRNYIGIYN